MNIEVLVILLSWIRLFVRVFKYGIHNGGEGNKK